MSMKLKLLVLRNIFCMPLCPLLQFKEISFAYEVLSNSDKRETYDRYGLEGIKEGMGGEGGGGKKDIRTGWLHYQC